MGNEQDQLKEIEKDFEEIEKVKNGKPIPLDYDELAILEDAFLNSKTLEEAMEGFKNWKKKFPPPIPPVGPNIVPSQPWTPPVGPNIVPWQPSYPGIGIPPWHTEPSDPGDIITITSTSGICGDSYIGSTTSDKLTYSYSAIC